MPAEATTNLERQIRSQPDALARAAGLVRGPPPGPRGRRAPPPRAPAVGRSAPGTSLHAAELGASLIQLSGRQAQAVPSMQFVDFAPHRRPAGRRSS